MSENLGKFAVTLSCLRGDNLIRDFEWGDKGVRIFEHPYDAVDALTEWSEKHPFMFSANMNGEQYYVYNGSFLTVLDTDAVSQHLESYFFEEDQEAFVPQDDDIRYRMQIRIEDCTVEIDRDSVTIIPDDGYAFGPGATGIWHNVMHSYYLFPIEEIDVDDLEVTNDSED